LILLETLLPGLDTFSAAEDIRSLRPGAKIGVLTRHNELALLARARRARLNGFVLKTDGFEELNYAIRTMLKGGFYTPPSMSSTLVDPTVSADPVENLTAREKSVFSLYAQGYGNQAIANTLHISVKTSETHLGSLARSRCSSILIGV
jgi:DNA-binding NarL/FixJ family response regulator